MKVPLVVLGCNVGLGLSLWVIILTCAKSLGQLLLHHIHPGVMTAQSESDHRLYSFHSTSHLNTWTCEAPMPHLGNKPCGSSHRLNYCWSSQAPCDQTTGSRVLPGELKSHSYPCLTLSTFQTTLIASLSRKIAWHWQLCPGDRMSRGWEHPLEVGSGNAEFWQRVNEQCWPLEGTKKIG